MATARLRAVAELRRPAMQQQVQSIPYLGPCQRGSKIASAGRSTNSSLAALAASQIIIDGTDGD